MKARHVLIVASFAVLSAVVGCGGGGGATGQSADPTLRAVNAVSDSASVSFTLDDAPFAATVPYGTIGTTVRTVDPGDYDLAVTATGAAAEADRVVVSPPVDQDFAVVALGLADPKDELSKRIRLIPFRIDRGLPVGDKARLIVVNALVREEGFENTAIDFQDGDNPQFPLFEIGYAAASTILVDSGPITYEVRQAGTELNYATQTTTLARGGVYIVLVSGQVGATGAMAPSVRFLSVDAR